MTPYGVMDLLCVGAINKTDMMVAVPAPRQVSKQVILKLNLKLDPEMYST